MKTNIWKDNKTLPEFGRDVLLKLKSDSGFYYIVSDFGNFKVFNPIEWCYLDDLLAQSSKVGRLEKALDIAKGFINYCADMRDMESAKKIREEITQALDKKE